MVREKKNCKRSICLVFLSFLVANNLFAQAGDLNNDINVICEYLQKDSIIIDYENRFEEVNEIYEKLMPNAEVDELYLRTLTLRLEQECDHY